jgi:hypothetical protein
MAKDVLKGTRWLLLKNPENLDPKQKARARLEEALRMKPPLATADWLEKLAGEDPRDPIRAYANRVRREGPRVARKIARLMIARPMSNRPAW